MNMLYLSAMLMASLAPAPDFTTVHGVDEAAYQAFVSKLKPGYRLTHINVHVLGGKPKFTAIALHDSQSYSARHNLSSAGYQKEFETQAAKGYRPVSVSGYTVGGEVKFAAAWLLDTPAHYTANHGITAAQYQKEFDAARRRQEMPLALQGFDTPAGIEYTATFVPDEGGAFETHHGLTADQYQALFNKIGKNGYWPAAISAYPAKDGTHFAVVFVKNSNVTFTARHGMTAEQYQEEFDRQNKLGLRPWQVVGYASGKVSNYAAVWVRQQLPVTGTSVPSLNGFDDAMLQIMASRGWTSGAIAGSKNGKTVLSRGYGYQDAARLEPTQPDAPFRIASVTKPLTAAVVHRQIAAGKYAAGDKALTLLSLKGSGDARLADITVQHLLDHKAGWDVKLMARDPMFDNLAIATALKRAAPAKPADVVDYMMTKKLQHKPGDENHYSNVGYCVLGRIIEKKSGHSYFQTLTDEIGKPLGMKSLAIAHTRRAERAANEPDYISTEDSIQNIFNPSGAKITASDGGFCIETMDSHGGLLTNAPDLLKFARAYSIDGRPRTAKNADDQFYHTGALAGTFTVLAWRKNDVQIAVLFNHRSNDKDQQAALDQLFRVSDGIVTWPN